MKKSRRNFLFALFFVLTVLLGAITGVIFSNVAVWGTIAALVVLAISSIARFHKETPWWGFDFALAFCVGFVMGSYKLLSLAYIIIGVVVIASALGVAFYIYTGCKKK